MSEMWMVPAYMEKTSLRAKHWKAPVWAPKIITPNSKAWTEIRVQALLLTWGDKTFLPLTLMNRTCGILPEAIDGKQEGALKLMISRKGMKDQA